MTNKESIFTAGKIPDIFINVVLPLLLGIAIYLLCTDQPMPGFLRNHLPDALWAYALQSSVLIIWNRKLVISWMVINLFIFISFETLQYYAWLPGTGDILDLAAYILSMVIALALNRSIMHTFYVKRQQQ